MSTNARAKNAASGLALIHSDIRCMITSPFECFCTYFTVFEFIETDIETQLEGDTEIPYLWMLAQKR
jgi:hypothetical protein